MKMRDDELVALCQAEIDACLGGDSGEIGSETESQKVRSARALLAGSRCIPSKLRNSM